MKLRPVGGIAALILMAAGVPVSGRPEPAPLPRGFARVTVQTRAGPVTVVLPRRQYRFTAQGATYYVSPKGDDAADGSKQKPWRTLGHAAGALKPGDLLYARAGEYAPFVVQVSGDPGRPIVLSTYPGERAVVAMPRGWQREHVHGGCITLAKCRNVWVHGFEIVGALGQPDAPEPDHYGQNGITLAGGASEGVRILNNTVSRALHCGLKEMGHGGTGFVFEGNVIYDCGVGSLDHGIYVPSSDAAIRGNAIFRCAGYGIHLYQAPVGCQVLDNVCFENGAAGIIVAGSHNTVEHNVCARNRLYGLFLYRAGCQANACVRNVLFDNRPGQIGVDDGGGRLGAPSGNNTDLCLVYPADRWSELVRTAAGIGPHTKVEDPGFADPAHNDFRRPRAPDDIGIRPAAADPARSTAGGDR